MLSESNTDSFSPHRIPHVYYSFKFSSLESFMRNRISTLALLACVTILSACSTPAKHESMTAVAQPSQKIAPTPLRDNLSIKQVSGGSDTNPIWTSNIGNPELEKAIEASLKSVGLFASKDVGRYMLSAHLEKVAEPLMGASFTVTTTIRYTITERASGKEVFSKTIVAPYTAAFGDALLGSERLRLAKEGAVRENIKKLIDDLLKANIQRVSVN